MQHFGCHGRHGNNRVTALIHLRSRRGLTRGGVGEASDAVSLSRYALDNYFRIDTLYAPNPSFRQIKKPDRSGRCICADQDYIEIYRERFMPPT